MQSWSLDGAAAIGYLRDRTGWVYMVEQGEPKVVHRTVLDLLKVRGMQSVTDHQAH